MVLLLFPSYVLSLVYFLDIFPQDVPLKYNFLSVLRYLQGYVLYPLDLLVGLVYIGLFGVSFLCNGRPFALRQFSRRPLLSLNISLRLFLSAQILLWYYWSNFVRGNEWLINTRNCQKLLPWRYLLGYKQDTMGLDGQVGLCLGLFLLRVGRREFLGMPLFLSNCL